MKFEFQEFYPITEKNRGKAPKGLLGTVHIYAIDCKLDLRGIKVAYWGKTRSLTFLVPHMHTVDHETGEPVSYPVYRFTEPKDHEEMLNFLHQTVKPIILERMKDSKPVKFTQKRPVDQRNTSKQVRRGTEKDRSTKVKQMSFREIPLQPKAKQLG